MLMPLEMKLPARSSMACSGRPMPSKMPPMRPGPRRTDMGSLVGYTGSPAERPPESSYICTMLSSPAEETTSPKRRWLPT